MKCTSCNERLGNTRCEGCKTLFCLPCMNKHHDGLAQQFQSLTDIRNEVKQSFDISQSTLLDQRQFSCFTEIDIWEKEMIGRIQKVAVDARKNVNDLLTKYMKNISNNFEQISGIIQQRQKEQSYMENDIETIKNQLNELKNEIDQINGKIQIDLSLRDRINWNTLVNVIEINTLNQATSHKTVTDNRRLRKPLNIVDPVSSKTITVTGSLSNWRRSRKSIEVQCDECEYIFDPTTNGNCCPNCRTSIE